MPITDHSLHVYHSALATTACGELLRLYAEDCKGIPALITEREQTQGGWLKVFEGHEGRVSSVAFSPDGKTIVSGPYDRTVRMWDAATGMEQHKMTGHEHYVTSVAFSPNGKTIVSGSWDQTVRVWDAATGVEQHTMTGHEKAVFSVAFSPDGKTIVSRDHSDTSYIWDADTGTRLDCAPSMIEIDTSRHPSIEHLVFQLDSHGWISYSSRGGAWQRVCWIPVQRRGRGFAYSGEIVCIGATNGAITILDFSPLGLAGR
jgi:WD40 repeat protein